jgi:hypothetical protein
MLLARYRQGPTERRKRVADYTGALETTEEIEDVTADITPVTTPPLVVDTITIDPDAKKFQYFISGGVVSTEYKIALTVETSGGQDFVDDVEVEIEES